MNIKSLLLGSAAALVAVSGAQAADAVVAPEPEAVEYVRVCDAYGAGYFYIPGTETCLRIGGYVRYSVGAGKDAYTGAKSGQSVEWVSDTDGDDDTGHFVTTGDETWNKAARFTLQMHTATETELGTLKTYTENRFNWSNGSAGSNTLNFAWMQLGGLRVGLDESAFHTFSGYLGTILNDDVVFAGAYKTNLISYTFTGGNGFSAVISAEQGGEDFLSFGDSNDPFGTVYNIEGIGNNRIDSYMPHVVGGVKYEQAWGAIAAVAAYDSNLEEWSGKVRLDVNVTDALSVWVQGGYASYEAPVGMYGAWGGDWAVWGGAAFKATEKATINLQAAYEDWGKTALAANVNYTIVNGLYVRPEVTYTSWKSDHPARFLGLSPTDALGFSMRIQRSF